MLRPARLAGQRGFSVPFESGHLLGTRVRQDARDGMVALLQDFSSCGSTYVVPWAVVPRTVLMTWYDGALHSRVAQLGRLSPSVIQQAATDLVAAGSAGHAAQADELARRRNEEDRLTALLEVLSSRILGEIGISVAALETGQVTRPQLTEACHRHGFSPEELTTRLEALASLLMPVGLPAVLGGTLLGPQRLLIDQIGCLAAHLERRAARSSPAHRAEYLSALAFAKSAWELGRTILARIDDKVGALAAILGGWNAIQPELAKWSLQLEMILDGWGSAIAFHAGVIDPPTGAKASHAAILAAVVPKLASELLAQRRAGVTC